MIAKCNHLQFFFFFFWRGAFEELRKMRISNCQKFLSSSSSFLVFVFFILKNVSVVILINIWHIFGIVYSYCSE
jgi:hypothetical protein